MKITFQFWTLPCKNIMLTLDAHNSSLMNVRTLQATLLKKNTNRVLLHNRPNVSTDIHSIFLFPSLNYPPSLPLALCVKDCKMVLLTSL